MNTRALIVLWNLTQDHPGTSGARAAAGVLLSLYNGSRFQLDLTDLRVMDCNHLRAALQVMEGDASRCQMEVHEWLNRLTGRRDFGERFEHLAHDYPCFKRGRCTVANLAKLEPKRLPIQLPKPPAAAALKLQLDVHLVGERMPDADTDVLIFEGADAEGQLGAFIGDDGNGPKWVGAQGQPVTGVTHWAEMPDLAKAGAAS